MSYLSDYANNVSNILMRQGEQQSAAIAQRGQAQQQLIGGIGSAIGGIPGNIAALKDAEAKRAAMVQEGQLRAGELDAQKRAAKAAQNAENDKSILDTAWSAIAKPDGSIDMDKLNQSVPGHLRDTVLSTYDKFQKAQSEAQRTAAEIKNLTAKHELDTRNALGALALGVKAHGEDNPESLRPAYTVAVSTAFKNGTITREQALQALTEMNGNGLMDHLNGLIRQSPEAAQLENDRLTANRPVSVGNSLLDPRTGKVIGTAPVKPTEHTVVVPGPNGQPLTKVFTTDQMGGGVPTYRAPDEAKPKFWVMRNGQALRVSESEYRPGDLPASTREQGRPVTSGDVEDIAGIQEGVKLLNGLNFEPSDTGIMPSIGGAMPDFVTNTIGFGLGAKQREGMIALVRQIIGKSLEGGVLRKEDEVKYAKILPTLSDPPELVKTKMETLKKTLNQKLDVRLSALEDAGYDTGRFRIRGDESSSKHVSMADLELIAKNRGTTVEQEKQRATAAGYVIR